MKTCIVLDCINRSDRSTGLCAKHHFRWKKWGTTNNPPPRTKMGERIWTLTEQEQNRVMAYIEQAFEYYTDGKIEEAKSKLEELWDVLDEFDVPA